MVFSWSSPSSLALATASSLDPSVKPQSLASQAPGASCPLHPALALLTLCLVQLPTVPPPPPPAALLLLLRHSHLASCQFRHFLDRKRSCVWPVCCAQSYRILHVCGYLYLIALIPGFKNVYLIYLKSRVKRGEGEIESLGKDGEFLHLLVHFSQLTIARVEQI